MRKQAQKLRNFLKFAHFSEKTFVLEKYGEVKLIVINSSKVTYTLATLKQDQALS